MKRRLLTLVLVLVGLVAAGWGLDDSDRIREWLPESAVRQQEGEAL